MNTSRHETITVPAAVAKHHKQAQAEEIVRLAEATANHIKGINQTSQGVKLAPKTWAKRQSRKRMEKRSRKQNRNK